MSELNNLTPENRDHSEQIQRLNTVRLRAVRNVFFAIASLAAVGGVYLATQTLVWTGGILLAGGWLWNSFRTFQVTSDQLRSYELAASKSLKEPVPVILKLGIVVGAPVALILCVSAISAYDPSLIPWNKAQPTIVEMYNPAASENVDGYLHYSGVVLDIPSDCSALTIKGKLEDSSKNEVGSYVNEFDSAHFSATPGAHIVIGTNDPLPDVSFISVAEASCR